MGQKIDTAVAKTQHSLEQAGEKTRETIHENAPKVEQELSSAGRKIEAIKVYREETGAGLKEAKDAVEAIERGQPFPPQREVDPPFERELVALLGEGRKIEAIKRYRERTGAGLKAAKDAVEALAARHGLPTAGRSGCLGAIALLIAAVALAWNLA